MREAAPKTIHLKDYTPPPFRVERVALDVDIRADDAIVKATLELRRNAPGPLVLDGEALELVSISLNKDEYELKDDQLIIPSPPQILETVSRIVPQKNTTLEGLYATKSGFATQCEAQGFRRITWFVD